MDWSGRIQTILKLRPLLFQLLIFSFQLSHMKIQKMDLLPVVIDNSIQFLYHGKVFHSFRTLFCFQFLGCQKGMIVLL